MDINLSNDASEQLKELMASKKEEGKNLRIYVAAYGWGGPTFGLALDEQKEEDEVFKSGEFDFILDKELLELYEKFNVDYSDTALRRGFTVTSNERSSNTF